jgi:hypothetical protein
VVEEQREQQAEDELADHSRADDEHDRVQDDGREIRVADEPLIVVEADETRTRRVDADEGFVGKARIDRPERGSDEEEREQDGRGRQPEEIRAVAPKGAGRRGGARADRPRPDGCGYRSVLTA